MTLPTSQPSDSKACVKFLDSILHPGEWRGGRDVYRSKQLPGQQCCLGTANWISWDQPIANPSSTTGDACHLGHTTSLSVSKFSCFAIFISCMKFFGRRNLLPEDKQIKYFTAVLCSRKYWAVSTSKYYRYPKLLIPPETKQVHLEVSVSDPGTLSFLLNVTSHKNIDHQTALSAA